MIVTEDVLNLCAKPANYKHLLTQMLLGFPIGMSKTLGVWRTGVDS